MSSKVLAKSVQFFKGVELMASKASMQTKSRNGKPITEVEVTPLGVKCTSFDTRRTILVPWANVTGCELFFEPPQNEEAATEVKETQPARGRGRPPKELTQ